MSATAQCVPWAKMARWQTRVWFWQDRRCACPARAHQWWCFKTIQATVRVLFGEGLGSKMCNIPLGKWAFLMKSMFSPRRNSKFQPCVVTRLFSSAKQRFFPSAGHRIYSPKTMNVVKQYSPKVSQTKPIQTKPKPKNQKTKRCR